MKIDFQTNARNANTSGYARVDSRHVFNFDGFSQEHTADEAAFLAQLTHEWTEIPEELLDRTTAQNFRCFARLPV